MTIEEKLAEMRLVLPAPFQYPNSNRTGCVRVGNLLFASGHPPVFEKGIIPQGKIDGEISESEGYRLARSAALNILSSMRQKIGTLDHAKRVVKVSGMVNSSPGFTRQFAVIDGASDLFYKIWGAENGQHARSAFGVFELPRGFPIEVEAIFELCP